MEEIGKKKPGAGQFLKKKGEQKPHLKRERKYAWKFVA